MITGKVRPSLLLVLLTASLAWAQKVKVGYDKSADFERFKTYAWIPRKSPPAIPLLATSIQLNIDHELSAKGLRKVDSNPDLLVSYEGGTESQSTAGVHDPTYAASGGYPLPNGNMWGGSLSADPGQQVMKGTLVIDLIDARRQQLVWRGTAKANLDYEHQRKLFDQASKAVTEIFKKYPPPKEQ